MVLVVRRLAALAVPPRSVIIERVAAAPPRPRDIIIERWVPYGAAAKRRTIVQRAAAAQQYQSPRNVIIQYEAAQVRIVRQFQRLGVTPESPQAYVQRYGASLLDSVTLVQQARAAGVLEDIVSSHFVRIFFHFFNIHSHLLLYLAHSPQLKVNFHLPVVPLVLVVSPDKVLAVLPAKSTSRQPLVVLDRA